jgi:hypothetical protein
MEGGFKPTSFGNLDLLPMTSSYTKKDTYPLINEEMMRKSTQSGMRVNKISYAIQLILNRI